MNLNSPRTLKPGNEAQVINVCTSGGDFKSCYLMHSWDGTTGRWKIYFSVNRHDWSDAEIGELVRWAQRYTKLFRGKAVPVQISKSKRRRLKPL